MTLTTASTRISNIVETSVNSPGAVWTTTSNPWTLSPGLAHPTTEIIAYSSGSNTEIQVPLGATNKSKTSSSITFVTTVERYEAIFSAQCERVSAFINNSLDLLDRNDDETNEGVVESIARAIDLVGEPAYYTALLETKLLHENSFALGKLLLAIGASHHKETEVVRLRLLEECTADANFRTRYVAVHALGRMETEGAKTALEKISHKTDQDELSLVAAALLR